MVIFATTFSFSDVALSFALMPSLSTTDCVAASSPAALAIGNNAVKHKIRHNKIAVFLVFIHFSSSIYIYVLCF